MPVPGVRVGDEKDAVTPLGCPLTESARVAGSLPCGDTQVNRTFVPCPKFIETVAGLAPNEHLGVTAVTVRPTVAVLEIPPPVAVTVTV